jgi:formylmethanofuran dehydrogenase subunit E
MRFGAYVARSASEEAHTEVAKVEEIAEQDTLEARNQSIYAGDVKMCFYHEGRDAVNSCSRCGQHICAECNYITGTHPICRNCWDKRASA